MIGVQQSRQAEPMSSASILTFHDSVELWLQLASEVWDVKPKADQDFMGYWEILQPKLSGGHLSQKESMRRLNKARVGLKHSGIWPNRGVMDDLRTSVTAFFENNTPMAFGGRKFGEISLVDLVQYPVTRETLKLAEDFLGKSKFKESLEKLGIAFAQLVDEYEATKKGHFGRSPFFFGPRFFRSDGLARDRSFDQFRESIEALQDAMKILSLGIDYRRYARFRLYTPIVHWKYDPEWLPGQAVATAEACGFCLDFVIESAIQLQGAEYETTEEKMGDLES